MQEEMHQSWLRTLVLIVFACIAVLGGLVSIGLTVDYNAQTEATRIREVWQLMWYGWAVTIAATLIVIICKR